MLDSFPRFVTSGFGSFGFRGSFRPAFFQFAKFLLQAGRVVSDHAQVPLSALDVVPQGFGRKLAGHYVALFAGNRGIQQDDRLFQSGKSAARVLDRNFGHRQFGGQVSSARFQFAQLPFESQQAGAFLQRATVAGVDKLSARDPVALGRHKHIAGRQR